MNLLDRLTEKNKNKLIKRAETNPEEAKRVETSLSRESFWTQLTVEECMDIAAVFGFPFLSISELDNLFIF